MNKIKYIKMAFLHDIGSQFRIQETRLLGFTGFPGPVKKINFTAHRTSFCMIFYQDDTMVKIKLFDVADPLIYYKKDSFSGESALRSNKPFLLNFTYNTANNETWCDMQIPCHKRSAETLVEVVAKISHLLCNVYTRVIAK